ncbi:MAG: hypothetical protein GYA24_04135, partial [Candidatus Lokiarchaeota archaeon]|nr:hypothetical protein [Candidatus Lokiarchaeota archaeon]
MKDHKTIVSDVMNKSVTNFLQIHEMDDFVMLFEKLDTDGFIYALENVDLFAFTKSGIVYATRAGKFKDPVDFLEARKLGFPIGTKFDDGKITTLVEHRYPTNSHLNRMKVEEMNAYLAARVGGEVVGGFAFYKSKAFGATDFAEYQRMIDGQFENAAELKEATKKGFNDSEAYRIAKKYACMSADKYREFVQKICAFLKYETAQFYLFVTDPVINDVLAATKGGFENMDIYRAAKEINISSDVELARFLSTIRSMVEKESNSYYSDSVTTSD